MIAKRIFRGMRCGIKSGICLMALLSLSVGLSGQKKEVIRLFPGGAPGVKEELVEKRNTGGRQVGGLPVLRITGVSSPDITVYPAASHKSPVMIVCPGGGYHHMAFDMEGSEVCEWLNRIGITGILLKYRVPRVEGEPKHKGPLQDLQRAISYVRSHHEELDIDSGKIGVMGFSAGGHLAVMASTSFAERTYQPVDAADEASCRPDYCLLLYPAYLSGEKFGLAPEIKVTASVPPTMLFHAENDGAFINSSLFYYFALKEAKVPAWLNVYSTGGHGFGIRKTGAAINEWPERSEQWFKEIGIIK